MDDASPGPPVRFRPTWRQTVARGLYLGVLVSVAGGFGGMFVALAAGALLDVAVPGRWVWPLLFAVPPLLGAAGCVVLRHRLGTEVDARGFRTGTPFGRGVQPWNRVVDVRAERRGGRTVVTAYLDTGDGVRLDAPYSGELLAADPKFDLKVLALSHLWRDHRFEVGRRRLDG